MILKTDNLSVGYGKEILIGNINIKIEEGKIITLIGPNGSGKSTILKTIVKQIKQMQGEISVAGQNLLDIKDNDRAKLMSMVSTERINPENMTCREIIETGRYPYTGRLGILSDKDREIVQMAIETVHAQNVENKDFNKISDGQRQRVMLARAICQDTPIIILDEPTSFLDMYYKLDILKTIWKLAHKSNKTIIMSLHELELVKMISDYIICVDGSKIVKTGTSEEIFCNNFIQDLYGVEDNEFDPLTGTMFLNTKNL